MSDLSIRKKHTGLWRHSVVYLRNCSVIFFLPPQITAVFYSNLGYFSCPEITQVGTDISVVIVNNC